MQNLKLMVVLGIAVAASACGGSSTAELNLLDAPPEGVTAVKIKVASMQVHIAKAEQAKDADPNDASIDDSDRWESLAVNKVIDLVQHQGIDKATALGELPLPEGKITQIRLVIDTALPENNVATYNGADCNLDVAKVAKKGIKINHVFKAFESKNGQKHKVYVDFDLAESMKLKGGCFELEPKLKLVKVKTDDKDVAL